MWLPLILELQSSSVVFVKRDLNAVAHSLVKLSILAGVVLVVELGWGLGLGTTQSNLVGCNCYPFLNAIVFHLQK